jgi:hypothetical protein
MTHKGLLIAFQAQVCGFSNPDPYDLEKSMSCPDRPSSVIISASSRGHLGIAGPMSNDCENDLEEVPKSPVRYWLKSILAIKVARGVGDLAAKWVYSDQELIIHLSNILRQYDYEIKRAKGPLGSILNRLMPRQLEHVVLDGQVIKQAYELARQPPPTNIGLNARYKIRAETVRQILSAISAKC